MSDDEREVLEQARKDADTDRLWLAAHLETCKGCELCRVPEFTGKDEQGESNG